MNMTIIFVAALSFLATVLGGYFSLRNQKYIYKIMAFTAGIILGVVFLEILPEIFEMIKANNYDIKFVMLFILIGFFIFHILERSVLIHNHNEEEYLDHKHQYIGIMSALALIIHSLIDGLLIGIGFNISNEIGIIIAIAVIVHNFTDGLNIVNFILHNQGSKKSAKIFLFFDALAPVIGIILATIFTLNKNFLIYFLSLFAGFLIYIAASDILPEAHKKDSSYKTILLTISGVLVIFFITQMLE